MRKDYEKIGDLIELIDERNKDLAVKTLAGLTIDKRFIPSVANTVGSNMKRYKIIRKNQFACSLMQVRRDGKMPIALLKEEEEAIISQAYPVFKVKNEQQILPEYLMMWFRRKEFDREATFHAVGGVRGSVEWEDFCTMELPVPSPEKQQKIIDEYQAVENKIKTNEAICEKLEASAQALYKHWFVDFEFPSKQGEPYKSSGGAMVWNDELEKEIPGGWGVKKLSDLVKTQYGYTTTSEMKNVGPKYLRITDIVSANINWDEVPHCKIKEKNFEKYKLNFGDILAARTGANVGYAKRIHKNFPKSVFASYLVRMIPNDFKLNFLLGVAVESQIYKDYILNNARGSAQPQANAKVLTSFDIVEPTDEILNKFNEITENIFDLIEHLNMQNQRLSRFQELLLGRMVKEA